MLPGKCSKPDLNMIPATIDIYSSLDGSSWTRVVAGHALDTLSTGDETIVIEPAIYARYIEIEPVIYGSVAKTIKLSEIDLELSTTTVTPAAAAVNGIWNVVPILVITLFFPLLLLVAKLRGYDVFGI